MCFVPDCDSWPRQILRSALLACVTLVATFAAAAQTTGEIFEDALANLEDTDALGAYLATLPRFGDDYLIDGDLRMTAREIRLLLFAVADSQSDGAGQGHNKQPELIVDKGGIWPKGQRDLTYAIDRASLGETRYARVVKAMENAAATWVAACQPCDLTITHVAEEDAAPDPDAVTFVVSLVEMDAAGLAFYPTDPPAERGLFLSPDIFEPDYVYDFEGIFRHEIGHVLGYRHEHARSPALGCLILTRKQERNSWEAIPGFDDVDIASAMHYPCAGMGTKTFELTDLDRAAHKVMYGDGSGVDGVAVSSLTESGGAEKVRIRLAQAPATITADASSDKVELNLDFNPSEIRVQLVIAFLGPDQNADASALISRLYQESRQTIPPARSVEVENGDSGCRILDRVVHLKCGAPETYELMAAYNSGVSPDNLQAGKFFNVPDVRIDEFRYDVHVNRLPSGSVTEQAGWIEEGSVKLGERSFGNTNQRSIVTTVGRRLTFSVPYRNIDLALQTFYGLQLPNATIAISNAVSSKRQYSSLTAAHDYVPVSTRAKMQGCKNGQIKAGEDAAYWMMLDSTPKSWPACARACTGPHCPQIVLPDSLSQRPDDLAKSLHLFDANNNERDLSDAIRAHCMPQQPSNGQSCEVQAFDKKQCHHALSMAAVMSASGNGAGFVGLAPDTIVALFDWQRASQSELLKFIKKRVDTTYTRENGPQIFVFASKLPNVHEDAIAVVEAEILAATGVPITEETFERYREFSDWSYPAIPAIANVDFRRLKTPQNRFTNPVVVEIANKQPLWITSAGQLPEPETRANDAPISPWPLDSHSVIAPMNLGDLDNVIVVTACDDCAWPDITLWEEANYGEVEHSERPHTTRAVTIAAPRSGYHAALSSTRFLSEHGGTSQAAAYVGGVAAAMTRCASEFYLEEDNVLKSDEIKRRLILTSLPRLQPSEREAAGVINPAAALRSPLKVSARLNEDETFTTLADAKYLSCESIEWFTISDAGEPTKGNVSLKNLRRILRAPVDNVASWQGQEDRWFLYAYNPASNVDVDIFGPVLITAQIADRPLIAANGRTYSISEIDELILPDSELICTQ